MKQPTSIIVQLVHIHGPLKGEIQEFSGNEIIIGRHASCDLQFPRDLVAISRKHANILRDGNRFKIVDQSTNGTFVNGERITEAYLKNGDVIFFTQGGPKVSFLTRIGEPVEPPPELKPCQSTYSTHKTPSQPVSQPISQPVPLFVPKPAPAPQPVIQVETVKVPLIIQYGPVLQSFNELPITIGTHPDCNLILEHPSLAERHIQIF